MGRGIRFRGLRITGSGFIFGYLVVDKITGKNYITTDHVYSNSINVCCTNCYEVIAESVGQFTGLKDKNGVDIYEGDIVKTGYPMNGWVYYSAPSFGIENKKGVCTEFDWEDFEKFGIIGNIHQTPELL